MGPSTFNPAIGFANHHIDFMEWVDSIMPIESVDPCINILARGGGKTTLLNWAIVYLGAKSRRKFTLLFRSTQAMANESVKNISAIIEHPIFARYYPEMSQRKIGKYGNVSGWNAKILRCANGFSVLGFGLDGAGRGHLLDEDRPDFIAGDDVDDTLDTEKTIEKKISIITKSILPSGAPHASFAFVQNLIHSRSIASKLVEPNGVDFLTNRRVIGPIPAIEGLKTEQQPGDDGTIRTVIKDGVPTWAGQGLDVCQKQINEWGIKAFLEEAQHEVSKDRQGALWNRKILDQTRISTHPPFYRVGMAIDPQASTGQTGIIVAGFYKIGNTTHGAIIADRTPAKGVSPEVWANESLTAYELFGCDFIAGEINHGGDMIEAVLRSVARGRVFNYVPVRATRGKYTRAEPVSALTSQGRVHMLGHHPDLENELCSWVPGDESPNRLDAMVWAVTKEMVKEQSTMMRLNEGHDAYAGKRNRGISNYG